MQTTSSKRLFKVSWNSRQVGGDIGVTVRVEADTPEEALSYFEGTDHRYGFMVQELSHG